MEMMKSKMTCNRAGAYLGVGKVLHESKHWHRIKKVYRTAKIILHIPIGIIASIVFIPILLFIGIVSLVRALIQHSNMGMKAAIEGKKLLNIFIHTIWIKNI